MKIYYIILFVLFTGGRYIVGGSRSDILVVRDARPDDVSSYSCEAQHALTGEKRRSAPSMVTVSRKYAAW